METVLHDMLFLNYSPWANDSAMCIKVDTVQVNIQLLIWDAAQLCPWFLDADVWLPYADSQ